MALGATTGDFPLAKNWGQDEKSFEESPLWITCLYSPFVTGISACLRIAVPGSAASSSVALEALLTPSVGMLVQE